MMTPYFRSHFLLYALIGASVVFYSPSSLASPLAESASADSRCRAVLSVSPERPFLADTLVLTIDVHCSENKPAVFPPFGEMLGELKIENSQMTEQQLVLTATPLRAGKTPLWMIPITCCRQMVIPAAELDITTTLNNEDALLENVGLQTDPLPEKFWHIYLLIAVLLLAALILLLLLLKRKKDGGEETITPLSAQELALRRLAALLESRTHESNVKSFFVELSDIVRWYAEQLTGIRAPELTTEEFLHKIARPRQRWTNGVSPNPSIGTLESLAPFLEAADIVKFAKHIPTADEIMLAYRRAEQFIMERRETAVHS